MDNTQLIEQNELLIEENAFLKSQLEKALGPSTGPDLTKEVKEAKQQAASWKLAFDGVTTQLGDLKASIKLQAAQLDDLNAQKSRLQEALHDAEQRVEVLEANITDMEGEARAQHSTSSRDVSSQIIELKDEAARMKEERDMAVEARKQHETMIRALMLEKVQAEDLARSGAEAAKVIKEVRAKLARAQECYAEIKKCANGATTRGTPLDQRLDVIIDAVSYEFKTKPSAPGSNTTAKDIIDLLGSLLSDTAILTKGVILQAQAGVTAKKQA